MSLLPQQIPPETTPIAELTDDGKIVADHNWWLFFYNIAANVLGGPAAPPVPPAASVIVGASPFTYLASQDGDLAVVGGLVSKITLMRYSVVVNVGVTTELFPVREGDSVTITYGSAPSVTFFPD